MGAKSTDYIRIDVNSGLVRKRLFYRQSDYTPRTISASIVNAGIPIELDDCIFAEILIDKADGKRIDNSCVISGGEVQYTLRTNDIAAVGENVAQFLLTFRDGHAFTTPSFIIDVSDKVIDQGAEESTNEYQAITKQLVEVTEMKYAVSKDKEEAGASVTEARSMADIAAKLADNAAYNAERAKEYADIAEEATTKVNNYASLFNKPSLNGREINGNIDEIDPTVPEWAKTPDKPSYSASEIEGAMTDTPIPLDELRLFLI